MRTTAWERYERGRAYNNRLTPNQYNLVNTNIEFFAGNQWVHLAQTPAMQKLPKPTFNIIKRVASLFVASLTSSAASVSFDELSYYTADGLKEERSAPPAGGAMGQGGGEEGFFPEREPDIGAAEAATAEVQNLLEKFKMDYRIREALFDGAQTGDYCAHFWWDAEAIPYGGAFGEYRGEIQMELVDGINVMFGNPNTPDVERQPYILIVGRAPVRELQREMEAHRGRRKKGASAGGRRSGSGGERRPSGMSEPSRLRGGEGYEAWAKGAPAGARRSGSGGERRPSGMSEPSRLRGGEGYEAWADDIQPDADYAFQAGTGGRTELEADSEDGKALYVYMYEKREGKDGLTTVHVTKATKSSVIYEDVDTGLSRYPIAWGNWEKQKNQYHGRALVTGIIPNQIFINSMFAMVMRHLQLMGFPKTVYNADLISQWSSEVGQAIAVRGLQPGQSISQVAYSLQPADMSNQIIMAIDKAITYTKDCLGATDAQMGNVRPDNTSALMVLQSSAEVPLENTRAGLYEWLEDIGGILLDMMGTYYGRRPMVRDREMDEPMLDPATKVPMLDPATGAMRTGKVRRRVAEEYDFSKFKNLWFNVRVNAGATTYYSEIAMVQTLDNLRREGTLEVIDYLERVPDKLIPRKAELVRELKARSAPQGGAGLPVSAAVMGAGRAKGTGMSGGNGMTKRAAPSAGMPAVGGALSRDKALTALPETMQARYEDLPKAAQSALLKKAML